MLISRNEMYQSSYQVDLIFYLLPTVDSKAVCISCGLYCRVLMLIFSKFQYGQVVSRAFYWRLFCVLLSQNPDKVSRMIQFPDFKIIFSHDCRWFMLISRVNNQYSHVVVFAVYWR